MKLAKKYRDMIDREWSEGFSGDGYWILLKDGFQWDGAQVVHEPTKTKAYRAMSGVKAVVP